MKEKKISIKAIILGNVADILGTNLTMIPLLVYIASIHGVSSLQMGQLNNILSTGSVHYTSLFLGGTMSIFGGYVAARVAKFKEYLHGALSALLCVLSGVFGIFHGDGASLFSHFFYLVLSPTLGILGAYFYIKTRGKK